MCWTQHWPSCNNCSRIQYWFQNWIDYNKFSLNSIMNSNVNSFIWIQVWLHDIQILHVHEFTYEFMNRIHVWNSIYRFMNSYINSCIWIHVYMNSCMILLYFSYTWIHIRIHIMNSFMNSWSWINMLHFMTYEYRYEFMYTKILPSCEIIYEIWGTKVPDAGCWEWRLASATDSGWGEGEWRRKAASIFGQKTLQSSS